MDSLRTDNIPPPRKIETTLEYMHKLFIMPNSSDRFIEFGDLLLDMTTISSSKKVGFIQRYPSRNSPRSSTI